MRMADEETFATSLEAAASLRLDLKVPSVPSDRNYLLLITAQNSLFPMECLNRKLFVVASFVLFICLFSLFSFWSARHRLNEGNERAIEVDYSIRNVIISAVDWSERRETSKPRAPPISQ